MDILSYFQQTLTREEASNLIKEVNFRKGEYVYMPPIKPNEMFQIISGAIKIGTYTEKGEEACYDILFQNEVFGNLRYLNGQFFEFAKALTDCKIICYELSFYKKMIVHDPLISDWFNKTTIQRWCKMETRLYRFCTLPAADRIKALFAEFDHIIVISKSKKVKILDLLHIVDIAQMTGISRQTVSKLLKSFDESSKLKTNKLQHDSTILMDKKLIHHLA
ncbi:Crp/Fnr family transcriptional regulator [Belliella kenyensis]|uniref:Crp/Fnr family transcriptional regulator n=1 Tax=Belliella kenyensis TaxID=1472724 RepID=A0ABV8EQK9_9BACT|nr:Crp/Fnr family transcriptional regulator [Belliella kenyensis]MCH7402926.1 Crp/Fnr family transcriptional regulator [Belliella kenyensis]MDN3602632.1 Crp/Fnr family transcriptional regulator [Belliella kenyensis]